MNFPSQLYLLNYLQSSLTVYILLSSFACCVTSRIIPPARPPPPDPHTSPPLTK
jgi:hypothetical protein